MGPIRFLGMRRCNHSERLAVKISVPSPNLMSPTAWPRSRDARSAISILLAHSKQLHPGIPPQIKGVSPLISVSSPALPCWFFLLSPSKH